MTGLLIFIFLAFVAVAAGFVGWPILRRRDEPLSRRAVLVAATVLLVLGTASGVYLMLGSPGLALRSLTGPRENDLRALVAELVARVRRDPHDLTAWTLLGRGYLTLGDPGDAAAAFRRAIPLAQPTQQVTLLSDYGEALTFANSGAVPPEAEAAFEAIRKIAPKDPAARFYLGLAYAGRRETAKALAIWGGLLADTPPTAPWRGMLLDRLAAEKAGALAQGATGAPDIGAMVARLAARLKSQPGDPAGWQRLIRAYSVLGEIGEAKAALADARAALKRDPAGLAAVEAEAAALKLQ